LRVAAVVIVVAALRAAESVLVPLMMALMLAVVSAPPLAWLVARRVPPPVAAALVLCANVAVVGASAVVIGSSATDFGDAVPRYQARLNELWHESLAWLAAHRVHVPRASIGQIVSPGAVLSFGADMVRGLAGLVSNMVVVLLILGFMLFEATAFSRKLRVLAGEQGALGERFEDIATEVQKYLFIKTIISLAMGIGLGVFVAALGIDFAVLWGLVAFLLNYIPNVGAFIAAIPPITLALISYGPGRAFGVGVGYLVVHMILGNILEPAWMGRRLGLSATVVFLSLLFWGWIWGPAGMFLSVPLTMVARILLEGSERTRWMAMLLDSSIPSDPSGPMSSKKAAAPKPEGEARERA